MGSQKNLIFKGRGLQKDNIERGLSKKEWAWTVCRLKGGLADRGAGMIFGGS